MYVLPSDQVLRLELKKIWITNWYKEAREVACLVRTRLFCARTKKVKIKIQNGLIDHLSASQSVYEDVRNNFNQSNQCFDALKCQKCAKIVYCVELFTFTFVFTKSFVNEDRQKLIRRSANNVLGTTYWWCFCGLPDYILRSSRPSRGSTSRARSAMLHKYYRRPSKPV